MTEFLLFLFAAILIYYVATNVAPHGLIFKLKKEEDGLRKPNVVKKEEVTEKEEERLVSEGQELFNKSDLNGAEKKFLSALKVNPNTQKAYHFLGLIYLRQNENKGAVATLEKACELDPLNDTDFNNLGLAHLNLGNYKKAAESLERSVSLNDKIAHRHLNLALAHQHLKDYERAAIALENAVKIHPNTESLTLLAKNYLSMKDNKLAEKAISQLLEVDPENKWAKRQIAVLKD